MNFRQGYTFIYSCITLNLSTVRFRGLQHVEPVRLRDISHHSKALRCKVEMMDRPHSFTWFAPAIARSSY